MLGLLRAVAAHPMLRLLVLGNFLSNAGTWTQRIAVGWLTFEFTGSASWVGIVAACEVVPSLLLQPLGGVLADRTPKWKLLAIGQGLAAGQAMLLTVISAGSLLSLPLLIACTFILGLLEGINQPSRLTIVADLAPKELLRPTISLNSFANNSARFIGPMAGGAALSASGPTAAFLINAMSFAPLVFVVFKMRLMPAATVAPVTTGLLKGVPEGLDYIRRHPLLSVILSMALVLSLCSRSVLELLPAISGLWFEGNSAVLATMTTCVGLGAMAGGLWMLRQADIDAVLLAVLTLPGIMIFSIFAFGFLGHYQVVGYVLLMVLGFCAVGSGVGMQSIIHLNVDVAFKGRVLSIYGLIQRAMAAIGAMLIGAAADRLGLTLSIAVACAVSALAWFLTWRRRADLANRLQS